MQVAVPALAKLCAKGVAKAGKSIFKFRSKDYDVKLDKPLTSKRDREPTDRQMLKEQEEESQSSTNKETITRWDTPAEDVKRRVCNFKTGGQACLHYSSVISRRRAYESSTCVDTKDIRLGGTCLRVAEYNAEHDVRWIHNWMRADLVNNFEPPACERDEWPPAHIWQARNSNVWIRLSPQNGNGKAGQLWNRLCPDKTSTRIIQPASLIRVKSGCNKDTEIYEERAQETNTVMHMDFANMPAGIEDQGLVDNPCWPKALIDDSGFACKTLISILEVLYLY
ncbi:hypothetical protein GQ44DRAFT_775268 [Phaeosphaeriaceae sp. PMI808]|nr:hypothetical protein GQ44DRAFT_775268 [Phaeosphaeriaceae sp. PMI808]